jgi:tRNA 5-methylaminomethyl-2-thiouridine biosynthesis bifunctional protein
VSVHEATVVWRGPTPHAARFDDLYYSADDPIGEVRHTFLEGVDFAGLCRHPHVTIGETGFGTGLNFLLSWEMFLETAASDATLDFVSVEGFPMAREDLRRAHEPFPAIERLAEQLRSAWPGAIPGVHRLSFMAGRIRLILLVGDARTVLPGMRFQADAWFLDGFAPARNPDMWDAPVLSEVARLSRPGAAVASFTAAGAVRRGLDVAGFEISKRPGFGRKRDCLAGTRRDHVPEGARPPWTSQPTPLPRGARIAVIGNGIAGRAMARAARGFGHPVIHVGGGESSALASASLPYALIAPKLTRGDQPFPVYWRQAFLDAVRELDEIARDRPIWVGERGVVIPPRDDGDAQARSRLADALGWPAAALSHDPARGLWVPSAGAVDTKALFDALGPSPDIRADVTTLIRRGDVWGLEDRAGATIAQAEAVVVACGAGTAKLLAPFGSFGLRAGLGRAALMRTTGEIGPAVLRDGYRTAADGGGRFMVGATAESLRPDAAPMSDTEGVAALRARIAPLINGLGAEELAVWRGTRCDTGDHVPVAGPVQDWSAFETAYAGLRHGRPADDMPEARYPPGLYMLSGLGARGFQAAFLLADHIAAMMRGRPSPVAAAVEASLAPGRFQIRSLRRGESRH